MYGSLNVLWHCSSLELECQLTFSSPVATVEFFRSADILNAVLLAASFFRILNSSTRILSPPPALFIVHACVCAKSFQSFPTLCDPINCSPPGSSAHGILQARILEWVFLPCPSLRDRPDPGVEPTSVRSPTLASGFSTTSTTWEALCS